MTTSAAWHKTRRRLVGIIFLLVFTLLLWLSIALYNKDFTTVAMVTLHTDSAGNEMRPQADVEMRGVDVGEVRSISSDGDGAILQLAIQPNMTHLLPDNVSAELLPKTLFGERYVDLVAPANPSPGRLTDGSVISQDRSSDAIELEKVLSDLMPMLEAVQPQKLSVTLTAISQALDGRGTELGQTLVRINTLLQQTNPDLPALDNDISQLVTVANSYSQSFPDIIQAMSDFTKTSKTIVDQQSALVSLYSTVTSSSQDLTTFLAQNRNNIIGLSANSVSTLQLFAKYSAEFPCTLQQLTEFEPNMDKILGKGTNEPGLHVSVTTVPSLGKYVYELDTPVYTDSGGPHCYPTGIPFPGTPVTGGAGPPTPPATDAATPDPATPSVVPGDIGAGDLGIDNSPQENEFVNELLAPQLNVPPTALPSWCSVLVGPVYRGTEVTLK